MGTLRLVSTGQQAAARITQNGGSAIRWHDGTEVFFSVKYKGPRNDAKLAEISDDLAQIRDLVKLDLNDWQLTDAGISHLAQLTTLQELKLDGTQITGKGLVHLEGMTELEFFSARNTHITRDDDQLARLREVLSQLESVEVDYEDVVPLIEMGAKGLSDRIDDPVRAVELRDKVVSDVSIAKLVRYKHLERLTLRGPQIGRFTDEGLAPLAKLKHLKIVYFNETPGRWRPGPGSTPSSTASRGRPASICRATRIISTARGATCTGSMMSGGRSPP